MIYAIVNFVLVSEWNKVYLIEVDDKLLSLLFECNDHYQNVEGETDEIEAKIEELYKFLSHDDQKQFIIFDSERKTNCKINLLPPASYYFQTGAYI